MRKIIAIGGGKFGRKGSRPDVLPICREILRLSARKHPKLLFLPTASDDAPDSVQMVERLFGKRLGCRVETLYLAKVKPSQVEIRGRILGSDIIFVGGGNTLKMMLRWKYLGVDKILGEAGRRGRVLCGVSAGAICWFRQGNSDSRKFRTPGAKLIKVSGLGYIDALACPHYDVERDRKPRLKAMMKSTPGVAVALDNCAALEVVGDRCRVITSRPKADGYRVYWVAGKYRQDGLKKSGWLPLAGLGAGGEGL